MPDNIELQTVIHRIQHMEHCLDEVLCAMNDDKCKISVHEDLRIRGMLQELTDYYDNGQWLQDYERDERGELPPDLKRGVLAQDTLYDLLYELKKQDCCYAERLDTGAHSGEDTGDCEDTAFGGEIKCLCDT